MFFKVVYFDLYFEYVRYFLQVDCFLVVSVGLFLIDYYDSDIEYLFFGDNRVVVCLFFFEWEIIMLIFFVEILVCKF